MNQNDGATTFCTVGIESLAPDSMETCELYVMTCTVASTVDHSLQIMARASCIKLEQLARAGF